MTDNYTDEAYVALVAVELEGAVDTTAYIVGCATPEETKTLLRNEYDTEPQIEIIVSKLSTIDAKGLKLKLGEIRPWN